MAYCTQSDIQNQISEDELIQLTDDSDEGAVDADILARAVADADTVIDSYCGTKYSVPFSTVPDMVRKLSVDIAIYNLYSRRMGAPDERKDRYDKAISFLRDVAKGMCLLGADTPAEDGDAGCDITVVKSDRIFSMGRSSDSSSGTLDGY